MTLFLGLIAIFVFVAVALILLKNKRLRYLRSRNQIVSLGTIFSMNTTVQHLFKIDFKGFPEIWATTAGSLEVDREHQVVKNGFLIVPTPNTKQIKEIQKLYKCEYSIVILDDRKEN